MTNKTNYYMTFIFDYKDEKQHYSWDLSFSALVDAIRTYFDSRNVTLDGTDNAIWEIVGVDLEANIDKILEDDVVISSIYDKYKNEIMEEFEAEWNYDHEGE
jgi:DNA-binding ferritin-like protein (Dps family)